MPHFCHIMTNNILPEILFSITTRHTFLFLSYFIYNKKFTRMKKYTIPQKYSLKKVSGAVLRKGVMSKKNASPVERISLCRSRFHANPNRLLAISTFSQPFHAAE